MNTVIDSRIHLQLQGTKELNTSTNYFVLKGDRVWAMGLPTSRWNKKSTGIYPDQPDISGLTLVSY